MADESHERQFILGALWGQIIPTCSLAPGQFVLQISIFSFQPRKKKNLKMGLPVLLDLQILFFSPPPNSPPSICAQCGGCDGRSLLYSACAGAALRLSLVAGAFSGRRAFHTLENDKK